MEEITNPESLPKAAKTGLFSESGAFSSLRHRDYRYFWLGNFMAFTGMQMQTIAQGWLMVKLTNSAFLLGLVSFTGTIPILVFSLIGGAVADRVEKRKLIHVTQAVNVVSISIIAVLVATNRVQGWQVFIAAFCSGTAMAFNAPARQAMVVDLVGQQDLMNAIALNSSGMNITRIFGPALAGILLASTSMAGTFLVGAACYAIAIGSMFPMRITGLPTSRKQSVWKNLVEGLSYIRRNEIILSLIALTAIPTIFGMSYQMLFPVFASHVLDVGGISREIVLGALSASNGVGALIGTLTLAFLGNYGKRGKMLIVCVVLFGVSLVLFALTTGFLPSTFALALLLLVVVGAANMTYMATTNTVLQTMAPPHLRGRVMSVFLLAWGLMPLGTLPAGAIAESVSAPFAVGLGGFITVIFVLLLVYRQRKIWHLA